MLLRPALADSGLCRNGSLNPVFVLPGALKPRAAELAQKLAASVTLGVGQFCTKPDRLPGSRALT